MPELPEVEVLVRHLKPLLKRRTIRHVDVRRLKSLGGTPPRTFVRTLTGATFLDLQRRGKYLLFHLRTPATDNRSLITDHSRPSPPDPRPATLLLGHLGMTGRMYLLPGNAVLPRHAALVLDLGREKFVFEDTRYFGRLTLKTEAVEKLGPEPFDGEFDATVLRTNLKGSRQPIKVKLLDQTVVAGVGNIYASEALFRAGISPRARAGSLSKPKLARLCAAIRQVLAEAIAAGSTIPLNFRGNGKQDGLFYYGTAPDALSQYEERLLVYDREHQPCVICRTPIRRVIQCARSTYSCPQCQRI